MKNKLLILWIIWSVFGAVLVYFVSSSESESTVLSTLADIISLSPLLGLLLSLGSEKASEHFYNWLTNNKNAMGYLIAGMAVLFAVPGILTWTFNPYTTAIFAVMVFAVFGSMKQLRGEDFALSWIDVAIWILLWIPFDLRW